MNFYLKKKTESEFILILTMWAKDKQSEIQMVKEISTCKGKFQQLPSLMGEKFASLNKILPVCQDYNPNDQERISNSQVGSEHAKCYSKHNSECIPFHVNKHVDCLS